MRWAWRLLRRTTHFLDDYFGEPSRDGIPAKPGVMARLQALTDDVAQVGVQVGQNTADLSRIKSQVFPNGGTSLRDAVDSVAAGLKEHREVTSPAIRQLAGDVMEMRRRMELFETQRAQREAKP